jgi:hypothetical protein
MMAGHSVKQSPTGVGSFKKISAFIAALAHQKH